MNYILIPMIHQCEMCFVLVVADADEPSLHSTNRCFSLALFVLLFVDVFALAQMIKINYTCERYLDNLKKLSKILLFIKIFNTIITYFALFIMFDIKLFINSICVETHKIKASRSIE